MSPMQIAIEKISNTLLMLEKKIKKELNKKQKENYIKLYKEGLYLKYILISIESKNKEVDPEYIIFEIKNSDSYCDKVVKYLN